MLRISYLIFAIGLSAVLSKPVMASEDNLVFSTFRGSPIQKIAREILDRAYGKLGYKVRYQVLPSRRSLMMSSNGDTDGEVARTWAVGQTYPSLKRVPTPLFKFQGYAYRLEGPPIDHADQLTSNLRVGIHRGVTWAEKMVENRKGVARNSSANELARKLLDGAIDVALYAGVGFEEALQSYGRNILIVKGKPIFDQPIYHYLHQKNDKIIAPVNSILMKMTNTGELEALYKASLQN